ncbi:MAG: SAF domain-containing protein, partial [Myxococcota bacterium]
MIWINLAVIGCAPAPVTPSGPPPPDIRLFVPGVVAASDLPAGRVVGPGDLVVGAVPSFVVSQVDDPAALVGYTVREPVLAGEPIRTERLVAPTDGREGYDALVEPGRAAVLLPVPTFALSGV